MNNETNYHQHVQAYALLWATEMTLQHANRNQAGKGDLSGQRLITRWLIANRSQLQLGATHLMSLLDDLQALSDSSAPG